MKAKLLNRLLVLMAAAALLTGCKSVNQGAQASDDSASSAAAKRFAEQIRIATESVDDARRPSPIGLDNGTALTH